MSVTQANNNTAAPRSDKKSSKSNRNKSQVNDTNRPITAYDPEMEHCYTIPLDRIISMPASLPKDRQICICMQYAETGACPRGEQCTGLHANVDGLEKTTIHINYAWHTAESVSYARLCPGETLTVLAPNNRPPLDQLASELVLVTKGSLVRQQATCDSTSPARPLSHCAHYYFNRICNRGEQCSFIHAVNIDTNAEDGQRAPAPLVVHRSAKAAPSALSANIVQASNPAFIASEQSTADSKAYSAECSEGGYISDDSACSGQTVPTLCEKAPSPKSPVLQEMDGTSSRSHSGSTSPCAMATAAASVTKQSYEVRANRVLIFSPKNNKEVVAFRHNPYFCGSV
jgi:hypothetical protein